MAKKIKVFHFSNRNFTETHQLSSSFEYLFIPLNKGWQIQKENRKDFFSEDVLAKEKRSIFIFDQLQETDFFRKLIEQLPNYQILYDVKQTLSPLFLEVLHRKFAIGLDFGQMERVFSYINEEYAVKQSGYKLSHDFLQVSPFFKGEVRKIGNAFIEISSEHEETFQQAFVWRMTHQLPKGEQHVFFPEVMRLSGAVEVVFKVFLLHEQTQELLDVVEASLEEIQQEKPILLESKEENANISVSLYLKGTGEVQIGQVHVRRAIASRQSMISGGANLLDHEENGDGIFYYFNPGDFKPPLAIYFSGYRPLEGFEGLGMMSKMGCPFMLIADPRLEGGNFYLSTEKLEKRLVEIIQEKLDFLGFTNQELVLSGLSMGTFGALYFASYLSPKCVIIGKPLTNLGLIAENGRIHRTQEFATAYDMMCYNVKGISDEKIKEMDEMFWQRFRQGDYNQTIFAIAYMKQDDYDAIAFPMLYDFLKEHSPNSHLLYRGFIGHHNDNSPAINNWFVKQYRNLMWTNYQRIIGKIV
ncbi:accessory secretory protein Asp2 [Pilibacter termitis]|uniref:Accessory secretory protein Asp2 n=1 Tax=Pilibacter termitis TaxID=263852 RepID=A0A1T4NSK1_9ENTE|nr:accessory Sec system protein Asp2 [Pilibacter termitis]SJZ82231.1 accessory secretory protein Asp2 [Pilibacter termitis]